MQLERLSDKFERFEGKTRQTSGQTGSLYNEK